VRTFRRRLRSRAPQGAVQASPCNWRPCRRSAGARIRGRRAARRRDASSGAGPPGPGGPSAAPASSGSSAWPGAAGPSGSSWSGAPRAAGSGAAGGERPWPGAPGAAAGAAAPGGPGAFAGAAPAAWDSGPPRPAAGAAPVASHCVRCPHRRRCPAAGSHAPATCALSACQRTLLRALGPTGLVGLLLGRCVEQVSTLASASECAALPRSSLCLRGMRRAPRRAPTRGLGPAAAGQPQRDPGEQAPGGQPAAQAHEERALAVGRHRARLPDGPRLRALPQPAVRRRRSLCPAPARGWPPAGARARRPLVVARCAWSRARRGSACRRRSDALNTRRLGPGGQGR